MSDQQLIMKAYQDTVETLFRTFYQACVLAQTEAEKNEGEVRFQTGIKFARAVRDRAIAILP